MPTHEQQSTVAGGLNLDDSLLTPAPGQRDSLFLIGDYRYALNGRIGSSRGSNKGAFENIRGTNKITSILAYSLSYSVESILSSTPWQEIYIKASYGDVTTNFTVGNDITITDIYDSGNVLKIAAGSYNIVAVGTNSGQTYIRINEVSSFDGSATGEVKNDNGDTNSYFISSMPAGTNKCVGFYENKADQNGIFWNWNSNGDHGVYRFELKDKTIYEVLVDSILNLSENKKITEYAIFDTLLFFTDGINPQRFFDIYEIAKIQFNIEAGGKTLTDFHINLIKYQPVAPPRLTLGNYSAGDTLKYKVYQACFRYVFKDDTRSVWSPRSNVATKGSIAGSVYTGIDVHDYGKIYGTTTSETSANNGLNGFDHLDIRAQEFISHIEVAVRESQYLPWRTIDANDFNTGLGLGYLADFTNDTKGAAVATQEINQSQDYIPLLSGAGAGIDNKIMLGDNTEDFPHYDLVITDPDVYLAQSAVDVYEWASSTLTDFPSIGGITFIVNENKGNTMSFKMGGLYQLGIEFGDEAGRRSLAYAPENLRFEIPFSTANSLGSWFSSIGFKIDATTTPPDWATWMQVVRSECLNIEMFIKGTCNGIQMRKSNTSGDVGKTVTEMSDLSNHAVYDSIKDLLTTIETTTAADASYLFIDIRNWSNPSTKVGSTARPTERDVVDIIVSASANPDLDENESNNVYYNFKEGDRVRFPAYIGGSLIVTTLFDEEIVRIDGTFLVVDKPSGISGVDLASVPPFIEVYRPKEVPNESIPLYECGEWYPILFPKTSSRAWAKTDWTYTDNASITSNLYGLTSYFNNYPVRNGDVHIIKKPFYFDFRTTFDVDASSTIVEVMNPDPEKTSAEWEHGSGRPNVAYENQARQRQKETQIKFSGNYIEDSIRNNLNNFEEQNQKIYPSNYGRIMSLMATSSAQVESVGTILLALFESETVSIYVNRTTSEELSGNTQILLSDKVLGSYNALLGSYGTLNPESVVSNNGRVYFYDANEGGWVRYSRDGLTFISEYKVQNFHKKISDLLIPYYGTSEEPVILGAFDKFNDELITAFKHSTLPATFDDIPGSYKVLGFNDSTGQKRWKCFYDYDEAEMFGSVNNNFLSFKDGELYMHEEGTDNQYGTFYGTKYDAKIEFITNQFASQNKVFQTINVIALDKWSVERFIGEVLSNSGVRMQSALALDNFEQREGTFYSDILNDRYSFGHATEDYAMVNGDAMRGKYLSTLLTLDPFVDYLTTLEYVGIGFSVSHKNPKN